MGAHAAQADLFLKEKRKGKPGFGNLKEKKTPLMKRKERKGPRKGQGKKKKKKKKEQTLRLKEGGKKKRTM